MHTFTRVYKYLRCTLRRRVGRVRCLLVGVSCLLLRRGLLLGLLWWLLLLLLLLGVRVAVVGWWKLPHARTHAHTRCRAPGEIVSHHAPHRTGVGHGHRFHHCGICRGGGGENWI